MTLDTFVSTLKSSPEMLEFSDTMAVIDQLYVFNETSFMNGALLNQAGENSGSCKLFYFAKLQGFTEQETLACFGAYYRDDVLANPNGADHQNIRNFIKSGWQGIVFDSEALVLK